MDLERRAVFEVRVGAGRTLVGVAAPYNVTAELPGFTERFLPGCWTDTLRSNPDIVCLQDHMPSRLLGRTRSRTLTLQDAPHGLTFTLALPDTEAGRDVLALAQRSDLGGVSVGMHVTDQSWTGNQRDIRSASLIEISIVSMFPAYPDTTVALRSRMQAAIVPLDPDARRRLLDMLR